MGQIHEKHIAFHRKYIPSHKNYNYYDTKQDREKAIQQGEAIGLQKGRIDITTETSMLASQMAQPREGHLVAVLRVISYLKKPFFGRLRISRKNLCLVIGKAI